MVKFNFKFSVASKDRCIKKETPGKYGYSTKDLNRICVYSHTFKSTNVVFYIGQGSLSRAFNFLARDNAWKKLVNNNYDDIEVKILHIDITVEESIKLEKEYIQKYGRIDLGTGTLVNNNDGGSSIGCKGDKNYFYDKHFYGEKNGNYGNKYDKNPLSIPIVQLDILGNIVKEWASAKEAEEIGNFISSAIGGCCSGKRHIHKGYQWIFKKDYDINKNYEYIPGKTNKAIILCFDSIGNFKKVYTKTEDLINDGFTPNNVNQVMNGSKKSHKSHIFVNFFKLSKEKKQEILKEIKINFDN